MTTNTLAGPEAQAFWDLSTNQELHNKWTKTWGPDSPRNARRLEREAALAARTFNEAKVWKGHFPRSASPNETLVRRGADGKITNYQTYDVDGLPVKRVDVTGRNHGGVETPHVVEFERHVNLMTGELFVKQGKTVRPATSQELLGLD